MKNKEYYIGIYREEMHKYMEKQMSYGIPENEIDSSEMSCTVKGTVGRYLSKFGNNAFKEWNKDNKCEESGKDEKKVYYILKDLCKANKKREIGLIKLIDVLKDKKMSNRLIKLIRQFQLKYDYIFYVCEDFDNIEDAKDILRVDIGDEHSCFKYGYMDTFDELISFMLDTDMFNENTIKECYVGLDKLEKLNDRNFLISIKNFLF